MALTDYAAEYAAETESYYFHESARAAMHNGENSPWVTVADVLIAIASFGNCYPISGDDMPHRRGEVS